MPTLLITDISASVMAGDDDTALDVIIQQFIDDWGLTQTVEEWRIANYADLRRWAYPPEADYFAELVAGDMSGEFIADCEAVNLRFPSLPENPATTAETLIDDIYYLIDADSTDTFIITDIPNPSVVSVSSPEPMRDWSVYGLDVLASHIYPTDGISWTVNTGTFAFKVDGSGEFDVQVISEDYEDKTFIVLAEDPA